jgi:hypothetical protein
MKLLVRIFISLTIFLLAGFGHLHASVHQDNAGSAIRILTRVSASDGDTDSDISDFKKATFSELKVIDKVDTSDNEDEDEKLLSLKKTSTNTKYLSATLYNIGIAANYSHNVIKRFNNFKRVYNLPSQKWYILFRVFRI